MLVNRWDAVSALSQGRRLSSSPVINVERHHRPYRLGSGDSGTFVDRRFRRKCRKAVQTSPRSARYYRNYIDDGARNEIRPSIVSRTVRYTAISLRNGGRISYRTAAQSGSSAVNRANGRDETFWTPRPNTISSRRNRSRADKATRSACPPHTGRNRAYRFVPEPVGNPSNSSAPRFTLNIGYAITGRPGGAEGTRFVGIFRTVRRAAFVRPYESNRRFRDRNEPIYNFGRDGLPSPVISARSKDENRKKIQTKTYRTVAAVCSVPSYPVGGTNVFDRLNRYRSGTVNR